MMPVYREESIEREGRHSIL